ncbi:MAG: T9SS type A sorting domain-containing protein [Bacteroidetes bacterium]|nr:T9SS type A sorting domain-containing protein [Bacteroidota bacterium]
MSVYPNPFTSEFILEGSKESGLVTLSDITGKKLISQKSNEGETRITPLNLAAGIYILSYEREGKIANLKVVKYE